MTGAGNVLRRGAVFHAEDALLYELSSAGAHDVGTKDLVSLRIGHKLDQAFGVVHCLGPAVSHEGELARLRRRDFLSVTM